MKSITEILGRQTIHPFPARMAPSIALEAIGKTEKSLRILDPMSGSGTVLAVARAKGHRAVGVDCDPLAVLNASVWTTPIDPEQLINHAKLISSRSKELFDNTPARNAYPCSDVETKRFLRFWFDQNARRQLWALSVSIGRVRNRDIRNALWSSFSRLIITKQNGVSLAMDLSHSRPHKVYDKAPIRPFEHFQTAVKKVAGNCPKKFAKGNGPSTQIEIGDGRNLSFQKSSFDMVITSPPYLNAIDYMRCSKFSLVWMGYTIGDLRSIRRDSIGSEAASKTEHDDGIKKVAKKMCRVDDLSDRNVQLLERFAFDMKRSIHEVARVLKPNGTAVYVIGNNQLKGVSISNSNAAILLAKEAGLTLNSKSTRELPPNRRYLPPPSTKTSGVSLQARMRTEVVLTFEKAS